MWQYEIKDQHMMAFERVSAGLQRALCAVRMYQRPFGMRGLIAVCAHQVCGRPQRLTVKVPGFRNPVTLRMRTTDVSICEQVLFQGHNALPLSFVPRTIVDLGANIGMVSIYYANRYPSARIVAVEAEASNFEMLRHNVESYSNIVAVHAAVWYKDGQVAIAAQGVAESGSKVGFAVRAVGEAFTRAVTMRTLMREMHISHIDLLKVDIEGAEKEVFETASDWIDNVRCVAIELHDRYKPGCREAVIAATSDFAESQIGETFVYVRKMAANAGARELQR